MTNEEINRRVAVALGGTPRVFHGTMGIHKENATFERWRFGNNKSWVVMPDFCRDPAADDLVKHHLKSRGCHYRTAWGTDGASAWVDTREPDYRIGESYKQECEEKALCLAFLAACEAQEGGEVR
jgi:hypothetical protein